MNINLKSEYRKGTNISLNINYKNSEKDLNKSKKYSNQSNVSNSDIYSIVDQNETKSDKNFNLNIEKEKREYISLDNSYKQGSKNNNCYTDEKFNENDSLNENDIVIKKNKFLDIGNNGVNNIENETLFRKSTFKKSTKNNKNVYSNVDASNIKSYGNNNLVNNIYQINNNFGNISKKKIFE